MYVCEGGEEEGEMVGRGGEGRERGKASSGDIILRTAINLFGAFLLALVAPVHSDCSTK